MIVYWFLFVICGVAIILAFASLALARASIANLRFAVRTAYNFGLGFLILALLLLISAMIMELAFT